MRNARAGATAVPELEPPVDERGRNRAVRLRGHRVGVDLLDKVHRLRRGHRAVADPVAVRLVASPHHPLHRGAELAPLVEERPAEVDMVEQHVRGARETAVLDPVLDGEPAPPKARLDAPDEMQVFAEHRGLDHLPFRPQHALVPLPAGAVPDEPRRGHRRPPVERVVHRLAGPG